MAVRISSRFFWPFGASLFALLTVSACGDSAPKPFSGRTPVMLYSPNAEPLSGGNLGMPACSAAIGAWFDRTGRGAPIGREVFLADAAAQYRAMDIDHNGYLVSEELERFRAPYRPPYYEHPDIPAKDERHHKRDTAEKDKDEDEKLPPGYLSDSMNDPVMSADANLDYKVTQEEFLTQAQEVFARLDANHDGVVSRAEALAFCGWPRDKLPDGL